MVQDRTGFGSFARRGLAGVWRRRRWTLPLGVLAVGVFAAGFLPGLNDQRYVLWAVLAFGLLLGAVGYVALLSYRHVTALSAEVRGLREAVAAHGLQFNSAPEPQEDPPGPAVDDGLDVRSGRHLFEDLPHGVYSALPRLQPKLLLDVGAAAGFQARNLAQNCPGSHVIAFEPFAGNWPHFAEVVKGTSPRFKHPVEDFSDRIELVKKAVCDHSNGVRFGGVRTVQAGDSGIWSSLEGFSAVGRITQEGARVPSCTIDEVLGDRTAEFAKVDVQGGEVNLLRGAATAIAERRVKVWLIEYMGQPEILDLLKGYVVFDNTYFILPHKTIEPDLSDFDVVGDVLLSTGDVAINAWPKQLPSGSYASFFARHRQRYRNMWTDLIFVDPDVVDELIG